MLLAHKIELRPTKQQADYLDRACDSRRHAFNQLLAHFNQEGVKWSKKAANEKYKELRREFPWYSEVSQRVTRNTVDDLHNAFTHFFRRVKKGDKAGYPKFKKRGLHVSFALREKPKFDVEGRTLRIEKLNTRIKIITIENLNVKGMMKNHKLASRHVTARRGRPDTKPYARVESNTIRRASMLTA